MINTYRSPWLIGCIQSTQVRIWIRPNASYLWSTLICETKVGSHFKVGIVTPIDCGSDLHHAQISSLWSTLITNGCGWVDRFRYRLQNGCFNPWGQDAVIWIFIVRWVEMCVSLLNSLDGLVNHLDFIVGSLTPVTFWSFLMIKCIIYLGSPEGRYLNCGVSAIPLPHDSKMYSTL